MVYKEGLKGKYVELKSAGDEDAEFTLSIRQDPNLTKFLPPLSITIEQQKEWIARQREREGDYFFVVWSIKTGKRLGTISVYDIHDGEGEGGRFALYGETYEKIEAGILMSEFEFNILKLGKVTGWVYCENSPAVRWNKNFGAVFGEPMKHSDGREIFNMVISKKDSESAREKLKKALLKVHV